MYKPTWHPSSLSTKTLTGLPGQGLGQPWLHRELPARLLAMLDGLNAALGPPGLVQAFKPIRKFFNPFDLLRTHYVTIRSPLGHMLHRFKHLNRSIRRTMAVFHGVPKGNGFPKPGPWRSKVCCGCAPFFWPSNLQTAASFREPQLFVGVFVGDVQYGRAPIQ